MSRNQITQARNMTLTVSGAGTAAYVASPIDVFPDIIPFVGQADDVVVIFAFLAFATIIFVGAWLLTQTQKGQYDG